MNTTQDKTPARPPESHARKIVLWMVASILIAAAVWAAFFQRSQLHMYVAIQASESLKIEFLQADRGSVDHCRLIANRVAQSMLSQCAACRVLVSRCLDKLDDRQEKILSGEPVEIPVMHTPTGAVAFISNMPELANEACRESERQVSGKLPVRCVAAGVASTAVSFTKADGNAEAMPIMSGTLGLILFAAVMSLVAIHLALRSKRLKSGINRDVTATSSVLTGSTKEFQFAETTEARPIGKFGYAAKRGFDIVGSIFLLVLLAPVFLIIIMKIRLDGARPIYSHLRIGRGGKEFACLKFQTMIPNADQVLNDLLEKDPVAKAQWEKDFKLKNDPRVTPFGAYLRRSSLDELPQLWNVLKGDMSLVGPRPIVREETARYGNQLEDYLQVRPGITGIWQVSGRNDMDYSDRVRLDAWYVKNWSLWHDIVILLKTVKVVLKRTGAY